MTLARKLTILGSAAKYDVSCASSGVSRNAGGRGTGRGKSASLGSATSAGICHTWTGDGRCISLLKVLFTNRCIFDCAYCINKRSNDTERTSFTVEELVTLTINFYKRNYIEGLFLSSGVYPSPNETMLRLIETARILRNREGFLGYIHIKAVPGAGDDVIALAGRTADRISVNAELPSEESLTKLAPQKSKKTIFGTMGTITRNIIQYDNEKKYFSSAPPFAPAGQSTQLIIGASPERDKQILNLSSYLYTKMQLRRVYFTAYVPLNNDPRLPGPSATPMRREHRLYQADWLMRFYHFTASEIVTDEHPDLDPDLDPKMMWALRNIHLFPMEITTADSKDLMRIPGIGWQSAVKIEKMRKSHPISFEALVKMGIVMRRARYFITLRGKYYGGKNFEPESIKKAVQTEEAKQLWLFT